MTLSVVQVSTSDGEGSGFFVDEDGGVVTSAHVVGGHTRATIRMHGGRSGEAIVVGIDEYLDLAYLKLGGGTPRPLDLADPLGISVGMDLLAVGFPLGQDLGSSVSVTRGILSSVRAYDGQEWLQTDAPINPGNSGGPLLTMGGRVVGVVTSRIKYDPFTRAEVDGVGYALSVREVQDRLEFLRGGGKALLPTPTPHPTPTPQPTPTRVKDLRTFEWRTGLSKAGTPYAFVLEERNNYEWALHLGCVEYKGRVRPDIYLTQPTDTVVVDGNSIRVAYQAGGQYKTGTWTRGSLTTDVTVWFPPDDLRNDMYAKLRAGETWIDFTVEGEHHEFFTRGFEGAVQGIDEYCGE